MAQGKVNERYFVSISPNEKVAKSVSPDEFKDACKTHSPEVTPNAKVGVHTHDSPTGVRVYTTLYLYPVDLTQSTDGKYTKVGKSKRTWELDTTTPKSIEMDY